MSLPSISAVFGILGVIASVTALTWQTMQLTRQVRTAGAAAVYASHVSVTQLLHETSKVLIAQPHLQPYFLAGQPCPPGDPNRSQALLLAGMIADIHDLGLQHTRKFADPVHDNCWPTGVVDALKQPILNEVFRTSQPWYPELRNFLDKSGIDPMGVAELRLSSGDDIERNSKQPENREV